MYVCIFCCCSESMTFCFQFKKVIEWLFVIADCFSHRLKSVTELAGLWSVLCSHCIKPLSITNDRLALKCQPL